MQSLPGEPDTEDDEDARPQELDVVLCGAVVSQRSEVPQTGGVLGFRIKGLPRY